MVLVSSGPPSVDRRLGCTRIPLPAHSRREASRDQGQVKPWPGCIERSEGCVQDQHIVRGTHTIMCITDLTRIDNIVIPDYKFQMANGQGNHWRIESPTILSDIC